MGAGSSSICYPFGAAGGRCNLDGVKIFRKIYLWRSFFMMSDPKARSPTKFMAENVFHGFKPSTYIF
ncbi:hypothetical protein XH88_06275 [Bradyrhizobium sp. CCBAU 51627]|nr:hypothetical protein [Bradyrhizobium sp. CCBAU 51627]